MLLSKFMTSQPRKQTAVHKLLNISRSKNNEIWSVNRIWHEKHFSWKIIHKMLWRTISRPFSKKSKLSISLNQWLKVLFRLLSLYAKLRAINEYWNEAVDHLLLPHVNIFWKKKRGLELVSLSYFPYDFWRDMCIEIVIVQYVHLFFNRLWCN